MNNIEELINNAMLSSLEGYAFLVADSIEFELNRKLTTTEHQQVFVAVEHVASGNSALLAKLEAAEKEISDWRSIAEAAAQDDADWRKLADSKNEVIVQLAQGIIKLKGRAVAAEIDRDLHYRVSKKLRIELIATEYALSAANEKLKAADQELIKPLPIGELVHRLEGQTYRKWYDDDEINKWRERAEAAEARLLVPVKLPKYCERYHWSDGVFNFKEDIIAAICAAGYPVEGESIATLAPAPAGVVMRPPFEKTLERCAAARDGECSHKDCPQIRDNEPMATGRHCPIDDWEE